MSKVYYDESAGRSFTRLQLCERVRAISRANPGVWCYVYLFECIAEDAVEIWTSDEDIPYTRGADIVALRGELV